MMNLTFGLFTQVCDSGLRALLSDHSGRGRKLAQILLVILEGGENWLSFSWSFWKGIKLAQIFLFILEGGENSAL